MTEDQELRAQYLRDAHDWAEDGELPDASADYSTDALDARLIAAVKGETTEPTEDTFTARLDAITEQMVKAAYEQGRDDERAAVVRFLRSGAAAVFTALELASDISGHVHLPEDDPA